MGDSTIQVKHLNGANYSISISLDETIGSLKEKVHEASNISAARQRIIYKGAEVHNHVQMRAAGLTDGAVVHLVERLIAPPEPGRQDAPPAAAARPEQGPGGTPPVAATMGGGLEVVNTLVQQMIGGLLGPAPSGGGSPRSPGSPRAAARAAPRFPNGLEAVHGFINAIGELDGVDDPPALLPVARSGVPLGHSNYEGVTRATTAILRAYEQQHGSLHSAIAELSNSASIQTETADQIAALFTRVDQAYQAHVAAPASTGAGATTGTAGATAGRTTASGTAADTTAASPLGQSSAPSTAANAETAGADGSNTFSSQQVEEQMQLAVLAFALTMARSAQCLQTFTQRITNRSQQLLLQVCREVASGERTFPASQALMEQLGTATNRASGLSLESAFLCSLYAQAVRGDHALLPDGMRPVVLQRDNSQNRTAAPGSSADAEATPEGSTTSAQTPAPGTAASLGSISINPGYAPLIVPHHSGHGSRFRMPAGMRSSVSVSGGPGQMEMFMSSPATDPAASDIIEEMLASGMISGATAAEIRAARGAPPPGSTPGTEGATATAPADNGLAAPTQPPAPTANPGDNASNPATSGPDAVPPMQPLGGLPIFHSEGGGAQHAGGMAGPGIHVSSSVVTGGLPFGNARGGRMDRTDGTVDVGGMIIQVELPPDGGASNPNVQTTGIGQLGSVLQNMMQEQLAAARMSQGRSSPVGQGPAGASSAAPGTAGPAAAAARESVIPSRPLSDEPAAGRDLPQRVLQLTQQFVEDLAQFENLPESQRDGARARMTQSYLRRVPQLLRDTVPGLAAGVDSFLSELQGGSGTTRAQRTNASASEGVPAPPAAATSAAAAAAAPSASAPPSRTPDLAAHALDIDSEDMSPTAPADASAPVLSTAAASSSTAASPASSSGAACTSIGPGSSGAGPSDTAKADRPEPKGLARGLKPRKPKGLGLGTASRAAPSSTSARSTTTASTGATAGTGTAPSLPAGGAAGLPGGLGALLGSLGGPGGASGGPGAASGGGNPLMDMMANMAQNPNIQRLVESPEMQNMADQLDSGNSDFGNLIAQMMPVVGNMLGGGDAAGGDPLGAAAPGASATSAHSTGAAASTGGSSSAAGVPDIAAFKEMMEGMVGPSEAEQWMRTIVQDQVAMRQQDSTGGETQHSDIYAAGAIPDEGPKGFLGM